MSGTLVIAATPIGNPDDASSRLKSALAEAEYIAAEDTRRLRRLAGELGVTLSAKIVSFFDGNEARRTEELLATLQSGADVLLVSDAGMPTVSDPGYRLVVACAAAEIEVSVLPGPSAVLAALAVSGLATDRFVFDGFLPRKGGQRAQLMAEYRNLGRTVVLFESPRRVHATLSELAAALGGGTPAAVCREITKTHEEIRRGSLDELIAWSESEVRGECVLVVSGTNLNAEQSDVGTWPHEVKALVVDGLSQRDAVDQVAQRHGVSRRVVYREVLASDS